MIILISLPSIMTIWVPCWISLRKILSLSKCWKMQQLLPFGVLPVPTVYWLSRLSRGYKGKHVLVSHPNFPLSLSRKPFRCWTVTNILLWYLKRCGIVPIILVLPTLPATCKCFTVLLRSVISRIGHILTSITRIQIGCPKCVGILSHGKIRFLWVVVVKERLIVFLWVIWTKEVRLSEPISAAWILHWM